MISALAFVNYLQSWSHSEVLSIFWQHLPPHPEHFGGSFEKIIRQILLIEYMKAAAMIRVKTISSIFIIYSFKEVDSKHNVILCIC